MAEVQPGTYDLIQTVKSHMTVEIDTPFCDKQEGVAGAFDPKNERIVLCPRGSVDADDHDTVRHEVWHVVQYCLTPRDSKVLAPVFTPGLMIGVQSFSVAYHNVKSTRLKTCIPLLTTTWR